MYGWGAHPGDSYYDTSRPSWLPYWIDTATESAMKWGAYPGVTQQQLNDPNAVYKPPPMPPAVGSTLPDGSPIPAVPESEAAAQATVDAIIAKQWEGWKAANTGFFRELDAKVNPPDDGGILWYWWLIGGLGVFGFVAMSAGRPRRYGR